MARYQVTQDYRSGIGRYEKDAIIDLDPATAEHVNRDAPGTLEAAQGEMVFVPSTDFSGGGGGASGESAAVTGDTKDEESELMKLTIPRLKELAEQMGIVIPSTITKKPDIVALFTVDPEDDSDSPEEAARALSGPPHHRMVAGGAQRSDEGAMTTADFGAVKRPGDA